MNSYPTEIKYQIRIRPGVRYSGSYFGVINEFYAPEEKDAIAILLCIDEGGYFYKSRAIDCVIDNKDFDINKYRVRG